MDDDGRSGQVGAYERALGRYVDAGGERQLAAAYEFGREAFGEEMTVLDVIDLHRQTVARLLQRVSEADVELVDATYAFLAESLSVFEMTQSGFREARKHLADERAIALSLQDELLPRELPRVDGLDVAVRYLPGESENHVGGDWYDVFAPGARRLGLVVGDVTGHGIAAVATMGRLRMAVLAYAREGARPAEVIERIDLLLDHLATGEMATMICAIVDPDRGRIALTNAGHPPPLIIEPDGQSRPVWDGHSRLIGMHPALPRRHQATLPLSVGSHVLLYTDGLIEPLERSGTDGIAQLRDSTTGFNGTAEDLCDHVLAQMAPQNSNDDICILAATLTGPRRRRGLRSRLKIPSLAPTRLGRIARR